MRLIASRGQRLKHKKTRHADRRPGYRCSMTFIISAATRKACFQVADTRLTDARTGALHDDFSVKTIAVDCADARVSISYTGLASIDGVTTGAWIADRLVGFSAWGRFFQDTMNYLRDELTNATNRNENLKRFGLEVSVIGLGNSPQGERQIAVAIITNCGEPQARRNQFKDVSPSATFQRFILSPANVRFYIGCAGAMRAKLAVNGMRRKLKKRLDKFETDTDPKTILDFLVAMLRSHRRDPHVSRLIGERCVAVAITNNLEVTSVSYDRNGDATLTPFRVKATPRSGGG